MATVITESEKPASVVYRKAFIKRRNSTTGLFEDNWFEITEDVTRWGKIGVSTTPERPGQFRFSALKLTVANDEGSYNPSDDQASFWFGFLDMQRTLVKIEFGFINQSITNGIWTNELTPIASFWDVDQWDNDLVWDGEDTHFIGIISGDPDLSDKNRIILTVRPLTQLFKDYPARRIDSYTTTGLTASDFMDAIRDHTTGGANFVFRPFFGDTTSNWDIQTTTANYGDLDTSTAKDVIDKTVWSVMEKLAQAERSVPYVDNNGVFKFKSLDPASETSAFLFGQGTFNTTFGNTIKEVIRYGPRMESFYSRVQIKFTDSDTSTSYYVREAEMTIGSTAPWVFGYRTFDIENFFIPDQSTAQALGDALFDDLGSLKKEITIKTSFLPHVKILDRIEISYDSADPNAESNWNENDWNTELTWDDSKGDAIVLNAVPHTVLKVEIDLDRFENTFIAREI